MSGREVPARSARAMAAEMRRSSSPRRGSPVSGWKLARWASSRSAHLRAMAPVSAAASASGVVLALDEVVLRAPAHGVGGHVLVVEAGVHHDRRAPGHGVDGVEGGQPAGVGEREVEDGDVGEALAELGHGRAQRRDRGDVERAAAVLLVAEGLAEEQRVGGVVLHEQDVEGGAGHAP